MSRRILYLSQKLPSSCGVARHHEFVLEVLQSFGSVVDFSQSGNAQESQSLRRTFKLILDVLRCKPDSDDFLFVELAGRFLCQFYVALFVAIYFPQIKIVTYVHDVPSIVGNARLFRGLDRKFCRWLSKFVFPFVNLENLLLSRSTVLATNELARRYVVDNYKVRCSVLPLIYSNLSTACKRNVCFVPGPISVTEAFHLLSVLVESLPRYRITIGFVTCDAIEIAALERAFDEVVFLGYLNDADLCEAYLSAKIVVRYRPGTANGNHFAASSPVVYGAGSGCIVVTNDARGSRDYFECGAGLEFYDLSALKELLANLYDNEVRISNLREKSADYYLHNHSVESAKSRLKSVFASNSA
jgi:glycosyltransferase involved in cell wall biosynthesis